MSHSWSPEEDALIIQLRAGGLSSSAIAAEMKNDNITRNSVIGRIHRLKLMGEIIPETPSTARNTASAALIAERKKRIDAPKTPSAKPYFVLKPVKLTDLVWPKPIVSAFPTRPIVSKRVTIFELERCMCRAPLWGKFERLPIERKFYCGSPTDGGSWCASHREGMFGEGTAPERRADQVEDLAA